MSNSIDPLSIGVGLIFGVIGNLLTIPVQRSLSTGFGIPKKLKNLEDELAQVGRFHSDRNFFYMKTISTAFITIALMGIGDAMWSLADPFATSIYYGINKQLPEGSYDFARGALNILGMLSYMTGVSLAISHVRLSSKIINFDRYKTIVEAKINLLRNQSP
ncbi:MAG: hypothetical protein ACOYN8_15900 [Pseudanabaena sp.]